MKTFIVIALTAFLLLLAVVVLVAEICNLRVLKKFKKNPHSVPTKTVGYVVNKKTKTIEKCADQPILPFPRRYILIRKIILMIGLAILGIIVFLS